MTYSIVACDRVSGDLGVAVQSRALAVGSVVPWAKAGVGAVATQSDPNPTYGPAALRRLASGMHPQEVVQRLTARDPLRADRQLGVVDRAGRSATFTGKANWAWAGGRIGPGYAAQGNVLAGPAVVDGLAETFARGGAALPELLLECLRAAELAGGDRRGRQASALLVVRDGAGFGGLDDRYVDLRVDDHPDPVEELARLLRLFRIYRDHARADQLVPLTETVAAELRRLLTAARAGRAPVAEEDVAELRSTPVGEPRPLPPGWDTEWQRELDAWIAGANLWRRQAAAGWIDPLVLDALRAAKPG